MIVAAAVKFEGKVYALPAPARHHDVLWHINEGREKKCMFGDQGFIDHELGFLARPQALYRAKDEGQLPRDFKDRAGELFSEDLW